MAEAMIMGLLSQDASSSANLGCSSGSGETARTLSERTGIRYYPTTLELADDCDVWVLAHKPFQLVDLPHELTELSRGKLIVSVLAGILVSDLSKKFPHARNIVRAMPNTPAQIGAGLTGYTFFSEPLDSDAAQITTLLAASGKALKIQESDMDALTAISGSGVAYIFDWAQAMIDAGVAQGLSHGVSTELVLSTFSGASALMEASPTQSPSALRDAVVSKGGTTEAALKVFAEQKTAQTIKVAVQAAANRSRALSRGDE